MGRTFDSCRGREFPPLLHILERRRKFILTSETSQDYLNVPNQTDAMAQLRKLFWAFVIVLVVFFITCFIVIRFNGKSLIESRASAILKRPVTVGEASFIFPNGVHLKDLNVEGLLFAPDAQARFSLTAFLDKNFELDEVRLDGPVLTLHRTKDNQIVWGGHHEAEDVPAKSADAAPSAGETGIKTAIRSLNVFKGQIHFPGHEDEGAPSVSVHNVQLSAKNVPLSGQPADTSFDCTGKIAGDGLPLAGDEVKGNGIINWPLRNMDADFSFLNPDGKADLEVKLNSRNNEMMVKGHLKTATVFDSKKQNGSSGENILLEALDQSKMALDMEFSFPTRMDRWELRNIEFSGNLNASIGGENSISGK